MKSLYRSLIVSSIMAAAFATVAGAGENSAAKILAHIGNPTTKNVCTQAPVNCRDAVVSAAPGSFYNVYICVGNHSDSVGVAGVQFGIDYNGALGQGVDVFSWAFCADLEFATPGWPGANSGNMLTWIPDGPSINCQYGPGATVAGYFYLGVYTPDRLSIIPRPVDGQAKVADCNAFEDDITNVLPSPLGYADFGTGDGYNPCDNIVAVEQTTWSGVKSLFR
jgi:hypothetical protein